MAMLSDTELLARLVAFASVSAEPNNSIADFVQEYGERAGCRTWRQTYSDGRKVNLLLMRGPQSGGGLLLSGHTDVVPAREPGWDSDPFVLAERNGRYFGRGVADMKAWVSQALNLICEIPERDLTQPLMLLLTADEEIGSIGAQRFAADPPRISLPKRALIGEPTGLQVVRMHKGHMRLRIRIAGKPAHSGYPQLGINAIERATDALAALRDLARRWREVRVASSDQFPACPFPVLNIAIVTGGSAVNIIPESCQVDFGVRLLPGQSAAWALDQIQSALAALEPDAAAAVTFEVGNDSPPMLCDPDAAINRELSELIGQKETLGISFASDAGTLQRIGMDCVLFGPGTIEDAHRANESIDIVEWKKGRELLAGIVQQTCTNSGTK